MQFITSKLKKFDFHRKAATETQSQTVSGAIITLISILTVTWLLFSNLYSYISIGEIENHMYPDKGLGVEDVQLKFDIEFLGVDCKSKKPPFNDIILHLMPYFNVYMLIIVFYYVRVISET